MSKAQELLALANSIELVEDASESVFTIKRIRAIRDGKSVILKRRKYAGVQDREGYKRDSKTGSLVRMTALEKRRRSKAAKKSQRKASTKRNREISLRRREQLIGG